MAKFLRTNKYIQHIHSIRLNQLMCVPLSASIRMELFTYVSRITNQCFQNGKQEMQLLEAIHKWTQG